MENLESVFLKIQTTHNNLVVKSQPVETIVQAFIRKVAEKVEKYMNGMDQLVQQEEN